MVFYAQSAIAFVSGRKKKKKKKKEKRSGSEGVRREGRRRSKGWGRRRFHTVELYNPFTDVCFSGTLSNCSYNKNNNKSHKI